MTAGSSSTVSVILDGGWTTTRDAEHALPEVAARLGLRPVTACTEFRTDPARVVVTLELPEPPPADLMATLDALPTQVQVAPGGGLSGRAFIFPGSTELTGVLRVSEVLDRTAISEVLMMGGLTVDPSTDLDAQDFVRPIFRDGRLILLARPGPGDTIVPFEQPNPTPCCATH